MGKGSTLKRKTLQELNGLFLSLQVRPFRPNAPLLRNSKLLHLEPRKEKVAKKKTRNHGKKGTTFIKVTCSHACTPAVPITVNVFLRMLLNLVPGPTNFNDLNPSKTLPAKHTTKLAKNDNFFSTTNISNKHCKKRPRRLQQQDFSLFSPLFFLIASHPIPVASGICFATTWQRTSFIACSEKETIPTRH